MRFFGGQPAAMTPTTRPPAWRWGLGAVLVSSTALMLLGTAVTWTSACTANPYVCTTDVQCVSSSGVQGECNASGFCAYPDTTCPTTGERYPASAGNGLANGCVPPPSASQSCINQIAVGQDWACYLRNDGTVWCWGDNSNAMIGQAPSSTSCPGNTELGPLPCIPEPTQIQGLPTNNPIVQLRMAEYHACAMATDQTVWCWGFNDQTNLGQCQSATALVQSQWPLQIFYPDPPTITYPGRTDGGHVSPDAGAVVTWASVASTNPNSPTGQTCPGAPLKIAPPNTGNYESTFTVGGEHTCVIDTNGKLLCWGENQTTPVGGQAGQDHITFLSVQGPLEVTGSAALSASDAIISVNSGDDFTCLKTSSGRVYCWGGNQDGELASLNNSDTTCMDGNPDPSVGSQPVPMCTWSASPTYVPFSSAVDTLAVDDETACVLTQGSLSCWGNGTSGIMESASLANSFAPVSLTTTGSAIYGGSNAETFFVANSAGVIQCWGANNFGQCASPIGKAGVAGGTNIITPQPSSLSSIAQLEVGVDHGCALTTDGELYCWGDNSYGELGNGQTSTTPTPVPTRVKVVCN
jgi:alpha-tubulin suppressor-like RCC1 family protein